MIRKALVTGAILLVGYLAGLLFGYRAAVVDYIENDAQTIQSMAETMYDKVDEEDLPEELQEAIAEARDDSEKSSDSRKGFQ